MTDLDKALAEITAIRSQIARGTQFRGYGPTTLAATAGLALLGAALQAWWLPLPGETVAGWIGLWSVIAVLSVALVGYEAVTRSRRLHSGLADEMIQAAAEHFVPAGVAGILIAVVLSRFAPETRWMLPGLWQIIVGLGLFASLHCLPRLIFLAGIWYLGAGLASLAFASGAAAFSPLAMGLPFGIGQMLIAGIVFQHARGFDDQH